MEAPPGEPLEAALRLAVQGPDRGEAGEAGARRPWGSPACFLFVPHESVSQLGTEAATGEARRPARAVARRPVPVPHGPTDSHTRGPGEVASGHSLPWAGRAPRASGGGDRLCGSEVASGGRAVPRRGRAGDRGFNLHNIQSAPCARRQAPCPGDTPPSRPPPVCHGRPAGPHPCHVNVTLPLAGLLRWRSGNLASGRQRRCDTSLDSLSPRTR